MSNNSNTKVNQTKIPDNYSRGGAQTPTYTPPPMPKVVPAKPSNPKK